MTENIQVQQHYQTHKQKLAHNKSINHQNNLLQVEKSKKADPSSKDKIEKNEPSVKSKDPSKIQSEREISQVEWQAAYDGQQFNIKSVKNNNIIIQQEKSKKSNVKSMKNNENKDNHAQQVVWEAAYIDQKYYLGDPESLNKLRALASEIQREKLKLAQIQAIQKFDKSFLSQKGKEDDQQDQRQQCLTQIDQSRLLMRKKHAQQDLLKLQQQYQAKINQIRKKKSILKKQIGCGTNQNNQKKMQVDEYQIMRDEQKLMNRQQHKGKTTEKATINRQINKQQIKTENKSQIKVSNKNQQIQMTSRIQKTEKSKKQDNVSQKRQNIQKIQKQSKRSQVPAAQDHKPHKIQSSFKNSQKKVQKSVKAQKSEIKIQKQASRKSSPKSIEKDSSQINQKIELPNLPVKTKSHATHINQVQKSVSVKPSQKHQQHVQTEKSIKIQVHYQNDKSQKQKTQKVQQKQLKTQKSDKSNNLLVNNQNKSVAPSKKQQKNKHQQLKNHLKIDKSVQWQQFQSYRQEESLKSKSKDQASNDILLQVPHKVINTKRQVSQNSKSKKQHEIHQKTVSQHSKKQQQLSQYSHNQKSVKNSNKNLTPSRKQKYEVVQKSQIQDKALSNSHVDERSLKPETNRKQSNKKSIYEQKSHKNSYKNEQNNPKDKFLIQQKDLESSPKSSKVNQNANNSFNNSEVQMSSQKKASFVIHSRQNSVKSKKSKSKHSSMSKNSRLIQFEQSQMTQSPHIDKKINANAKYNQSQSQAINNQKQIKQLHQQILNLQEKLKAVQAKQEQMIKFQNNPSRVMSELEVSHGGSGSQPASPLGKFNLTSRLRLQSKLSLQGPIIQFNTHQQKLEQLKKTAEQNQKLEKLHLQQQIGRLKKVIRDMQIQKIMSIQHDFVQNKDRKSIVLQGQQQNNSKVSDFMQTKKNQWNSATINKDDTGKIKKNSPAKYFIDSPKKYNRLNAEKSKNLSQLKNQQQNQQIPLPARRRGQSFNGTISRQFNKSNIMNKVEQNEKNFQQFLQASRLIQQPESYVQQGNQSLPEAYEVKNESQLPASGVNTSPPQYKKTINRNYSQLLQKLKNQNPQDQIQKPKNIVIGNIELPNLPQVPHVNMTQNQLIDLARKTYKVFNINIDEDQNQLCMKKYKNCIVFTFGNNQQQTILWHYSGKFYYGGWKNVNEHGQGQKIGQGLQFIPGKHVYRGQFSAGKKNGNGIVKLSNGNIYDGQWVDGAKNGRGVYFQASTGTYYSGEWKDGKRDGYGILKFSNQEFYQGTFVKSIKHGYGIEKFVNGDFYKGQYQKGKFHGKGRYCWSNGSSYQGDFVQGSRHGQGNWKSARKGGDIYIGAYQNDKKCGYGRYVWSNNCVYQGQFKDDLKNGKGRLIYQDGKQIKGNWKDGSLISSDQQLKKTGDHENQPLRRSIRASSLKNAIQNNNTSSPSRRQIYL